ncbi:hypothetical protein JRO89_XS06G0227600 [Xanthoceras sorbifolium]|uniref:Uncharacterized protein n=1 Tax=Xanthoceras sorbifolium TaxID=99658 RepID=A0ABQ8HZ78_9ROSI|nr:hypothetical protein JRO89_XS06G0227600 [Xanthoceras sorbifolium]
MEFRSRLLVLEEPTGAGYLAAMKFNEADFWVNRLGATGDCLGKYLRVRVRVDILKPLKRSLRLELGDGEDSYLLLRYEKLQGTCKAKALRCMAVSLTKAWPCMSRQWTWRRSWAGMANGPLRLAVPSKLQQCAISLDVWNRSSLQMLRREIARTHGRIRVLGLQVTASSWRELQVQELKLDDLLRQDEDIGGSVLALLGWPVWKSGSADMEFLGTEVEFEILNHEQYSLEALIANVYMCSCSSIPEPTEKFKTEVRLPWSCQYLTVKDDMDL